MKLRRTLSNGASLVLCGLLSLLAGSWRARADCPTNDSAIIDLSNWSVVQYGPFGQQPPANWVLSQTNTVATQTINADPSILLSPFVVQNDQIQGSWRVDSSFDDDFIGFVFGYQDNQHFYLFDWKQLDQPNYGVFGERGMTLKVVSTPSAVTAADLYATTSVNTNRVRTLYHNTIPWVDFTDYQFDLQFQAGQFTITVSQGASVLASFTINDSTYPGGRFGFYNFSQDNVRYAGFTRQVLTPRPLITVAPASVVEGHSGTTNLVFNVRLSGTNCDFMSVDYALVPGTATEGVDYSGIAPGTLLFAPGETNLSVTVPVLGERLIEANETVFLRLSNPTNGTLNTTQFTGTIINDDFPPSVALISPGPTPCLTLPTNLLLVAQASVSNGAIARVQFFDSGTTLLGEVFTPPYELVWPNVPPGAHVLTAVAWDDGGNRATSAPVTITASYPSALSINDRTVAEGNGGVNAIFNVTLSPSSCRTVTVSVVTFEGTALTPSDYSPVTTTLTFLPGQTLRTVSVPIVGDTVVEPDENFTVCLTNVTGATLQRPCGIGTIINDDTNRPPTVVLTSPGPNACVVVPTDLLLAAQATDTDGTIVRVQFFDFATNLLGEVFAPPYELVWSNVPAGSHLLTAVAWDDFGDRTTSAPVAIMVSVPSTLSIEDRVVIEGNAPGSAVFSITLTPATCRTVTVEVLTFDGTALASSDYTSVTARLTFLPGQTSRTVSVPIVGDTLLEPDEDFTVCLTNATGATVSRACGLGTIINDDTNRPPTVALTSPEPNPCLLLPTNLLLVAQPNDTDGVIIRVQFFNFTTLLGEALAAPYEFHWLNVPLGSHQLTAVAWDDYGDRATSAPVAISASQPSALSIDDPSVLESDTGTHLVFTITLAPASCRTVSVETRVFPGTATAGTDYTCMPATIQFLPGETTKFFSVPVIGDRLIEPDEDLIVCLTNATGATVDKPCGTGLIINDDSNLPPTITITYPADGAVFSTPPGHIPIQASAQDSDGVVTQVQFFANGILIGTLTNGPFAVTWTNNVIGLYELIAIATDDAGATGTSAPVRITVRTCDTALSASAMPNQTRCLCDEVIFSTTISSGEPVTIAWRANGVILTGETNSTLRLYNLHPTQAGVYSVEVTSPCASVVRSATLTLKGAGNQNPVSFTNAAVLLIRESGSALPYPAPLVVDCVPGPIKHLSITLDGFNHSFPDDTDVLLASPTGPSVRLLSDCGAGLDVTNLVLTFTDTASTALPDLAMIQSGTYRPTDYADMPADSFPLPAPQNSTTATNLTPFLGSAPNGNWALFVRDDALGDGGAISNGWRLTIEWQDTPPRLTDPHMLADGRFQATLHGLPRMTHIVEASSDLVVWEPVSTNTFNAPLLLTILPQPGDPPWRFLRAVRCP